MGGENEEFIREWFQRELEWVRLCNYRLRFEESVARLAVLEQHGIPLSLSKDLERLKEAIALNQQSYEFRHLKALQSRDGAHIGVLRRITAPFRRDRPPEIAGTWKVEYQKRDKLKLSGQVHSTSSRALIFADDVFIKSASTQAAVTGGISYRKFVFPLQSGLLTALPATTHIAVSTQDGPLLYSTGKCTAKVAIRLKVAGGKGTIRQQLADGWLTTKKGTLVLRRDRNTRWQRQVLNFYAALSEYFEDRFGYRLWLIYGSLLGLCRSNSFIPHDDDFDVAFLSRATDASMIRRELLDIANGMINDGWPVRISANGVLAPVSKNGSKLLDIYSAWMHQGKLFAQSTTAVPMGRDDVEPLERVSFCGHRVLVPANPEAFLSGKYGHRWRSPDPSYRKQMSPGASDILDAARPNENERAEVERRTNMLLAARQSPTESKAL